MNEIVSKTSPAPNVKDITVRAPVIARKRRAGQFVIVRINETGERIPLTIVDSDPDAGTIRLIFQEVGKTTFAMGELEVGDSILDVAGPLGNPTHIEKFGAVAVIGGGIGVAPVYPIASALKKAGNEVFGIIGARTRELLILEKEMAAISDRLIVTTDDGSYGKHGFVTDALKELLDGGVKINLCLAIGPVVMMRAVARLTKGYNLPTVVSLNSIMVDGTGMCGGCRISEEGRARFVCVDGPEFDGHKVDFEELIKRQQAYVDMEREAMERYRRTHDHSCLLDTKIVEAGRMVN